MALQLRRVTEQQRQAAGFIPVQGEPIYAYDSKKLYIGDGTTIGGVDIAGGFNLAELLGIEPDGGEIIDGAFIYYSSSDQQWHIGQPTKYTHELDDVTTPDQVEEDFMIAYDATFQKWLVQERISKSIEEVQEFDGFPDAYDESGPTLLEYDETTGKFQAKPAPPKPRTDELGGFTSDQIPARGHLWLYDEQSSSFKNNYIVNDIETATFANLYGMADLDYIKYSSDGLWEKETPFLKDVNLISIDGATNQPEPEPVTFIVTLSSNGKFALNGSERAELDLFLGVTYIFDLSDSSLVGKTFRLSRNFDGTHQLEPNPGTILEEGVTITGTEGVDGQLSFKAPDPYANNYYYFCVEEPELGAMFVFDINRLNSLVMQWDSSLNAYDPKLFTYDLNGLENVVVDRDEQGLIRDKQMVAWDAGNKIWTTPGNMVPGVTGPMGRRRDLLTVAIWTPPFGGLGSFDITLEEGEMLESIEIDEEGEFDLYLFDSEEERQDFFEKLEKLLKDSSATLAALADEAADAVGARKMRLRGKQVYYESSGTAVGGPGALAGIAKEKKLKPGGSDGSSGGGGGGGGFDLPNVGGMMGGGGGLPMGGPCGTLGCGSGNNEPGLDDFTSGLPSSDEGLAELKDALRDLGKNLKNILGAIVERNRAIEEAGLGGEGGGGLGIKTKTHNYVSDQAPPMMFGWRASTDYYGYYLFTFESSASSLTYNTSNHHVEVQSCMRRVGCSIDRGEGFKILFYYDADDTRYIAGPWLRIVELQQGPRNYTGTLTETPTYTLRSGIQEYDPTVKYLKKARVLYDNKIWELLIDEATGVAPGPGTELAPQYYDGSSVVMFVEIPAFSVKSQVFDTAQNGGVYQLRCTLGKDSGGGKIHPVFTFEGYDSADYLYVGVNLIAQGSILYLSSLLYPTSFNTVTRVDTRAGTRQYLANKGLDIGVFMYDINVHSALQHLMVGEFQTFNIESILGQCDLTTTQYQYAAEHLFGLSCGNSSNCTRNDDSNIFNNPVGIPCYRGIHRPYGNMGFHIDGINIQANTGAALVNKDPYIASDSEVRPVWYIETENLPKPTLSALGDGAAFLSNFFTFRRQDLSDFVYFLPKSLGGSYNSYLGDRIKWRRVPNTNSLAFASSGLPYQTPIDQSFGELGPFNMNISPPTGIGNVFASRICVKRKGPPLTPKTKVDIKETRGITRDENGDIVSTDAPPPFDLLADGSPDPSDDWPEGWTFEPTDEVVVSSGVEKPEDLGPGQSIEVTGTIIGADNTNEDIGVRTVSITREQLSQSAICIGVIDEASWSYAYFENKWASFREQFPSREYWLLNPVQTDPEVTKPFPTSILGRYPGSSGGAFAGTGFVPLSHNQRVSSPLTYKLPQTWEPSWGGTEMGIYPVWITPADNGALANAGKDIEIIYKIRPPFNLATSYRVKFLFATSGEMTVHLFNPTTNTLTYIGSASKDETAPITTPNTEIRYFPDEIEELFTPSAIYTEDTWLELRINVRGTEINPGEYLSQNKIGFGLRIDASADPFTDINDFDSGQWYRIFNAWDWASIPSALYNTYSYQALYVPHNFMSDHLYNRKSNGPYAVTRDNGSTANITDWFALCGLERYLPGTIVGLFLDRSGSMSQGTVQASYSYFYQRCAEAGLIVKEVQNSSEDWVEPFFTDL